MEKDTHNPATWFHGYFDAMYLEIYSKMLVDTKTTLKEVSFLRQVLDNLPGGAVLDLACGYGRHCAMLKNLKKPLVGVDLNLEYLKYAQAKVGKGHDVRFVHGNMRYLPCASEQFMAVYSLFTSFGYFLSPEALRQHRVHDVAHEKDENNLVLEEIHRVLLPGGRFILDLPNKEPLIAFIHDTPFSRRADGRFEVIETWKYHRNLNMVENQTIFSNGRRRKHTRYFLHLYSCNELTEMLRQSHLSIRDLYGDFDFSPYTPHESDRMIVVAEKNTSPTLLI